MAKKKHGKLYRANATKVDSKKKYTIDEALGLIDSFQPRKFDESIEVSMNLGVDPKQSDQMVRGAATLPHGIGKDVKVLVVARGEAEKEARDAGADFVGNDDMIEKIVGGWMDFDRLITTPDALKDLTKVAKILGPKGMMPNRKTGTVTTEIGKAVKEQKLGKVEYKVEKEGIIHTIIGKKSFGAAKLKDNFMTLYDNVMKQKPTTAKGIYMQKVAIAPTMGPGLRIDIPSLEGQLKAM